MEKRISIEFMNAKFLSGAKATYPSLKRIDKKKKGKKIIIFVVNLTVPIYEKTRKIKIIIEENKLDSPMIFSDGPKKSKHRYPNNSLCIWQPKDKKALKWVFQDGLLQLLALIQLHLFREYYWRETGNWVGLEAKHN